MTLRGWWPLHDGENGTAKDYSGNNNHGNLNGGVTTGVAGKGGLQAMSFDGAGDYVSTSLTDVTSTHSVSVWVKPSDLSSRGRAISKDNVGASGQFIVRSNSGVIEYIDHFGGGNIILSSGALSENKWHHICGVTGSNEIELYIDGELIDSSTIPQSADTTNLPVSIGTESDANERYWNGLIGDARVFDRALTQQEVQQLYKMSGADVARPRQDGISRYPLDGDATDAWGDKDGTNNGASFVDDSIRGQAGRFQSSNNDYIESGNGTDYGDSVTVSAWLKPKTKPNSAGAVSDWVYGGSASEKAFVLGLDGSGDRYKFLVNSGNGNQFVYSSRPAPTDDWSFVVGVYNGSESKLYVNSSLQSVNEVTDSIGGGSTALRIGLDAEGSNYYWNGLIDDVRIYDYALSPSEIHELYRWGTRGKDLRKHLVNRRQ